MGADAVLVTTGPFKELDADLMLRIFGLLDQAGRLLCVSQVCKGGSSPSCFPLLLSRTTPPPLPPHPCALRR